MESLFTLISKFRAKRNALSKVHDALPRIMGEVCIKIIKTNFVKSNPQNWAPRKEATNKAYAYGRGKTGKSALKGSVFNASNPILKQTGNLRDSNTYQVSGKSVEIGVFPNSPKKNEAGQAAHSYAKHLNEGGTGKWGKNTTYTVARKFIPKPGEPPTAPMVEGIKKKYDYEVNTIYKEWQK